MKKNAKAVKALKKKLGFHDDGQEAAVLMAMDAALRPMNSESVGRVLKNGD